jgi:hypothetical protein
MNLKFGQLILKAAQPQTQVEVFAAEEGLAEDSNLGLFFAILEISSREKKAKKAMEQIIATVKTDYYNSPTSDPEVALETVCQNLNHTLPEIIENPKIWLPKLNIFIGAIKDEQICLSSFGKIKAFLMRDNKMMPILSEEEPGVKTKTGKIMSHLVVGEIKTNDALIFANATLFDYFSREKIKKTVLSLNPEQSAEYFKNLLSENINPVSFGALIFKIAELAEEEKIPTNKKLPDFYGTRESMDNLVNMERKTSKVLSASFLPGIKNALGKLRKTPAPKANKDLQISEKPKISSATMAKARKFMAFDKISPLPLVKRIKEKILATFSGAISFFNNFKTLNKRSRIIGYIILVLVIVFLGSLPFAGSYERARAADKKFQAQKTAVEDALTKTEAELIYKNEAGAMENLKQTQILLANLPMDKSSWQKEAGALSKKVQDASDRIYHVFGVEAASIVDFKNIGVKEIKNIAKAGDKLFTLSDTPAFYQIDTNQKAYQPVELSGNNLTALKNWDKKNLIFVNSDRFLVTYNAEQKSFSVKKFQFGELPIDWYVYAEKIYTLKQAGITKISQPLADAPAETNWYSDKPEYLSGAKQIMVDGDVWLSDGVIERFYRGKKTAFGLTRLDRGVGDDLEIYTENEWANLYILDKKNNRLIVAAKSGTVERQFKNDKLSGAGNLVISDKQDKAWLVNNAEIIEVDLTKR